MGTITTGVGLVSGINTGQLIDNLIALESQGKVNLQTRLATIQAQRTALLDINARLLNFKNASASFRLNKIFQSALATSSDESVLTATASTTAQPGSFQFIVKQLVASSQKISQGFSDRSTTPLGLTSLSFEFGKGALAVDRELEQLNAGAGVDRGHIKITDRSGAQATVDLTDVTTLNETIARINSTAGIHVTASIEGDHLVITDSSGGTGVLTVANGDGDTTASDLGIAGTAAADVLTGTNINTLGGNTALKSLNDGNGVLTRNNVTDFTIKARDGTLLNVDLGRINQPIANTTLLSDLNNGLGVTISADDENRDFKIIDRNGETHEVNLTGITTVGGVISQVAIATGGAVTLSINPDGKRLTITDHTGGAGTLKVLGDGVNGDKTATDLGILNAGIDADSFDGQIIPNVATNPPAATINDVIDRINNAAGNGGKIVASIAPDGVRLLISDTTGGAGNLIIQHTSSNLYAASELGIETDAAGVAASSVNGSRLTAALGSVLVRNLNGGTGLNGGSSLSITDRTGANVTVSNLDGYDSLSDIVKAINDQAAAANVHVTVATNSAGNGLQVTDSSGGSSSNLIISGDAADALGITADVAANSKHGSNLQLQYVSPATKLTDLNYGRGVGLGKFRITDALGATAVLDIGSDSVTLQDVIDEINSRGLAINARINDHGDGLVIESKLQAGQVPFTKLKIESVSGTTAKDLNILGTSSTIENASIDGSYERTVSVLATDTLDKIVKKINDAGVPVTASIISAGSGATPYRLNLTSKITGRQGELIVDTGDVDLGLTTLTKGQDAKVFFGSSNPEDGFLITSGTNTITSVLDGVTINLQQASANPVTLTVSRDVAKMTDAVKQFVTTFNDAIGRINQYDFYDDSTQQRGPLLGNPTAANVRDALYRVVQGSTQGVNTQYKFLRDVGVTIGKDGLLQLDEDKFDAALENDPQAVANLFAAYQAEPASNEEIAPGVTVQHTDQLVTVRGFGDLFNDLLDGLTNSLNGMVTLADKSFQDQIDLLNRQISDFDERLDAKRQRLQTQFAAMESALAKLQGQGNALNSLAGNVALAQSAAG